MLVAREPALSGFGVLGVMRFTPIFCQPVLAEIRAQNARALLDLAEKFGVPIEMLWKPTGGIMATPAVGEPEDPPTLTGVRQPG